jgi:hypothetical protein
MVLIGLGSLQNMLCFCNLQADLGLKDSTSSTTDDRILETLENLLIKTFNSDLMANVYNDQSQNTT